MVNEIIQLMVNAQLSFFGVSAANLQQWLNSEMPLGTLIKKTPVERLLPESTPGMVRQIAPNATYDHDAARRLPASHNSKYSYTQINQRHMDRVQKSEQQQRKDIQESVKAAAAVGKVDTSWYQSEGVQMTWGQFLENINDGRQLNYHDEVDILKCSTLDPAYRSVFNFLFDKTKKKEAPSLLQLMEIGAIERQTKYYSLYDIFTKLLVTDRKKDMGEGVLFIMFRRPTTFFGKRGGLTKKYYDDLGGELVKCPNLWEMIREVRAYKIFLSAEDQLMKQATCIPRLHRNNLGTSPVEKAKIYIGKLLPDEGNGHLQSFINLLIDEKNNATIVNEDMLKQAKSYEATQERVFSIVLDRLLELRGALFYASQEHPDWKCAFSSISDIIEDMSKKTSSQIHTQEQLSMSIRERLKGFQMVFKSFLDKKPELYNKLNLLPEFRDLKHFFETKSFSGWVSSPPYVLPPPAYEEAPPSLNV